MVRASSLLYTEGKQGQNVSEVSPILIVDHYGAYTEPHRTHMGEGINAGFYDGAARWMPLSYIDMGTPPQAYYNDQCNRSFWTWAKVQYGVKSK